ncbi:MAG: shikimate dehydrogenase [Pseudomonadota bacterium]
MTALYGVIGDPIAHSLSPLIHNGWIRDHGLDAEYLAMQVQAGALSSALDTLKSRNCRGLNITLPHKEDAFRLCTTVSDRARSIGAVNTLSFDSDGAWRGDNTDAPGFRHAVVMAFEGSGFRPFASDRPQRAVLIGAGGASRAVAYVFGRERQNAVFCNRTLRRARSLVDVYAPEAGADVLVADLSDLPHHLESCTYVVNATSLGHSGKSVDWPEGRGRLVYDLSYGKAAEAFLEPARLAGWRTVDGLLMLVAQAAVSFEVWFGIRPDMDAGYARAKRTLEGVT